MLEAQDGSGTDYFLGGSRCGDGLVGFLRFLGRVCGFRVTIRFRA